MLCLGVPGPEGSDLGDEARVEGGLYLSRGGMSAGWPREGRDPTRHGACRAPGRRSRRGTRPRAPVPRGRHRAVRLALVIPGGQLDGQASAAAARIGLLDGQLQPPLGTAFPCAANRPVSEFTAPSSTASAARAGPAGPHARQAAKTCAGHRERKADRANRRAPMESPFLKMVAERQARTGPKKRMPPYQRDSRTVNAISRGGEGPAEE